MAIMQNGDYAKWLLGEMAIAEMVFRRNGH
jgi:hypothetical protein